MAFTALKPCSFAGQRYKIGETIPDELIHPENVNNLVKMGKIAVTGDDAWSSKPEQQARTSDFVSVDIKTESGVITLEVSQNGLQSVMDALTSKATDAEKIISELTESDALILLHAADSRKTIKEAAEKRASEITETSDE